jgi:hypothetical protein
MGKIKRRRDWVLRLEAFLNKERLKNAPNKYTACCFFAADAILCMTDTDVAEGVRYLRTSEQVEDYVKKCGGMLEAIQKHAQQAHFEEIETLFIGRGDLVAVRLPQVGYAAGVVSLCGRFVWVKGEDGYGIVPVPYKLIKKAWRVG